MEASFKTSGKIRRVFFLSDECDLNCSRLNLVSQLLKGMNMAQYKYSTYLNQSDHDEYDKTYTPGQNCPNSGIYRCETCGDEIASNKGNPFPPQNHHQHAPGAGAILWKLIVFAQQKK